MIAQVPWYLGPVISFVLGGGLLAAVYALLKIRPEAGQFTVTAAQGVVVMQTGLMETLRKDLDGCWEQIRELKKQAELVAALQKKVDRLETELSKANERERVLIGERDSLHQRVRDLGGCGPAEGQSIVNLQGEETRDRILAFLAKKPAATYREIAAAAGVAAPTVFHHVQALKEDGRIRSERCGCCGSEILRPRGPNAEHRT
jgi:hypothetical protein